MRKGDKITTINEIDFFFGGWNDNGWNLIYTKDDNFHVPENCDFLRECQRIYRNYYE